MISLQQVGKAYGPRVVLRDVTASFRRGRVSYLLGRNGAGKTTLFKCLAGLESHRGSISFDGLHLDRRRPGLFPAFDDCPVYPHLSGSENLRFLVGRRVSVADAVAVSGGLLDSSMLANSCKSLSYGQRKKLYIAALVLVRPPYAILDELANGLDFDSLDWLRRVLAELKQDSVIIAAGHQFDFYDRVADDVFALDQNGITQIEFQPDAGDRLERAYLANCSGGAV